MAADGRVFLIVRDPGPYPLAKGAELLLREVAYGLRYGTFYPGTVLLDRKTGQEHQVKRVEKGLALEPPNDRLSAFDKRNGPSTRELSGVDLDWLAA